MDKYQISVALHVFSFVQSDMSTFVRFHSWSFQMKNPCDNDQVKTQGKKMILFIKAVLDRFSHYMSTIQSV